MLLIQPLGVLPASLADVSTLVGCHCRVLDLQKGCGTRALISAEAAGVWFVEAV
jgi:hypothetical protein